MTVREAGKGIVSRYGGTYVIGYTDCYGEEQETELSAKRNAGSGTALEFLMSGI